MGQFRALTLTASCTCVDYLFIKQINLDHYNNMTTSIYMHDQSDWSIAMQYSNIAWVLLLLVNGRHGHTILYPARNNGVLCISFQCFHGLLNLLAFKMSH